MTTKRTRSRAVEEQVVTETVLYVRGTHMVSGKQSGEGSEKREVLAVHKFETEPAYVRVNAGFTKNLQNYESLRLDVSISMPCYAEEVDAVFPQVADRVGAFLSEEMANYDGFST